MRVLTLILLFMTSITITSQENAKLTEKIIALEKAALERWNNGDVYGYLELSDDAVTYFDPSLECRMDGLNALKAYYVPVQGKIKSNSYEMINPKVEAVENMAVLSFNLNVQTDDKLSKWNCTEVYRKNKEGKWKIIQTHWSIAHSN